MPIQSGITHSGLSGIRAVRFPFARGVTPSVACLYLTPQEVVDSVGTLTLTYNEISLQFPDMAIKSAHLRQRHNGHPILAVHLLDRRWRWAGKTIGGDWNRRTAAGEIDEITRKSPAELATLLLDAIGESGYDVSQMPGGVFPRCNWQNERADIALQRLCDYVACEVVLNPLTNQVEIWRLGQGNGTPTDVGEVLPKVQFAPRANVPNRVVVICGDSLWQSRLRLQAACRDYPSNQQKSLSQTNIKPAGGWDYEHPWIFAGLSGNAQHRIRAFEDVYRMYKIIGQENGTLPVGNFPFPITNINQYILQDYILYSETDYHNVQHSLQPYVEVGECWGYLEIATNHTNSRSFVPFVLHRERQIVEFNTPLFKLSSTGTFAEPTLYLITAYKLKTVEGFVGGIYRFGTVGGDGGDLLLRRPELFSVYDLQSGLSTEEQTIAEADAYVQIFIDKYQSPYSSEITYPGLVFGTLNGNIAQVTWEWVINKPPRTRVYEGGEYDVLDRSAQEKRFALKLEELP